MVFLLSSTVSSIIQAKSKSSAIKSVFVKSVSTLSTTFNQFLCQLVFFKSFQTLEKSLIAEAKRVF